MTKKETLLFLLAFAITAICFFIVGKKHEKIIWIEKNIKNCTNSHLCPNTIETLKRLRDYQIELHNDTVWVYDGDRPVGSYITNWKNQIDSIFLPDNE